MSALFRGNVGIRRESLRRDNRGRGPHYAPVPRVRPDAPTASTTVNLNDDASTTVTLGGSQKKSKPNQGSKAGAVCSWIVDTIGLKYIGLIVVLVLYTLLGAFIVPLVENAGYATKLNKAMTEAEVYRRNLSVEFCDHIPILYTNAYDICMLAAERRLSEFEAVVSSRPQFHPQWTFADGLVFAATIYTTIGYSAQVPRTDFGRIFTMVYAVLGIPLLLVLLDSMGKLFCRWIHRLWVTIESLMQGRKVVRDRHQEDLAVARYDFPVSLALTLALAWMIASTVIFWNYEHNWSFLTAFYFCFISLSTIGLGDVMPSNQHTVIINFIFIIVGLALVSMCINVIQFKIEIFMKELIAKIQSKPVDEDSCATSVERDAAKEMRRVSTSFGGNFLLKFAGEQQKARLADTVQLKARMRVKATQTDLITKDIAIACFPDTNEADAQTVMVRIVPVDTWASLQAEILSTPKQEFSAVVSPTEAGKAGNIPTKTINSFQPVSMPQLPRETLVNGYGFEHVNSYGNAYGNTYGYNRETVMEPAREIPLHRVGGKDDFKSLLREIDFIITDCRDILTAVPQPHPLPQSLSRSRCTAQFDIMKYTNNN